MDTPPGTIPYKHTIEYSEYQNGKLVKVTTPIPAEQAWMYHMLGG